MKSFLSAGAGFCLARLPDTANVDGPSEELGAARMPSAAGAILFFLILFLLTVSSARADAVLVKDLVYVDSETGAHMSAYDTSTLTLRWRTDLSSLGIDGPLSVTVDKKDVFVGIDTLTGGAVAALSAATGEILWSTNLPSAVYSSPTVTKDFVYVGSGNGVWVLVKATGQVMWATFLGTIDSSPAVDKDVVYASSSDSGVDTLWALDSHTGEILFSTQLN
jgi:outer membrane protein assembly factor BamB